MQNAEPQLKLHKPVLQETAIFFIIEKQCRLLMN
jgi:hypothetical protein